MWRHSILQLVTDVSEEPAAFLYPNGRGNATPATILRQNAAEHCDNFRSHIQYVCSVTTGLWTDGKLTDNALSLQ